MAKVAKSKKSGEEKANRGPVDLPQAYHDMISRSIDEKGVYPHQMMAVMEDGSLGVYALMLNEPHQVMTQAMKVLTGTKDQPPAKELMYGLDRFTKPGQGTTLADCIGGAYWNGEAWKVFVIEYQHEPRIVNPIDWDNEWWKSAIKSELTSFLDHSLGQK